jgi:pyrimidine-specific ribonucleoside hydrolase
MRRRSARRARLAPLLSLLALLVAAPGLAHEESHTVVVDTDMALDDVRALALLLSSDHVSLEAAVVTEGASGVPEGVGNLGWVLERLGEPTLPIAAGRPSQKTSPPWREMSESLGWVLPEPRRTDPEELPKPEELLQRTASESSGSLVYLCLGPATSLAHLLDADPSLAQQISAVYYLGDPPQPRADAWNTRQDPESLRRVLDAGVRLHFVWLDEESWPTYDDRLLETISGLEGPAARLVMRLHQDDRVRKKIAAGHLRAWDETAVLAMLHPELVVEEPLDGADGATRTRRLDTADAREKLIELFERGGDRGVPARRSVVLRSFPVAPSMMRDDVAGIVPELIERHGLEEWKAAWLTSELHRHLGIYSVIGAKMGIRARELLGASLDEVEVTSRAGLAPPLACLNDGLQVATGASLGRGTIAVDETQPRPAAEFVSSGQSVELSLRDEVIERIRGDIRRAVRQHGNLTPAYFAEVRRLALRYWAELDREQIFVER